MCLLSELPSYGLFAFLLLKQAYCFSAKPKVMLYYNIGKLAFYTTLFMFMFFTFSVVPYLKICGAAYLYYLIREAGAKNSLI